MITNYNCTKLIIAVIPLSCFILLTLSTPALTSAVAIGRTTPKPIGDFQITMTPVMTAFLPIVIRPEAIGSTPEPIPTATTSPTPPSSDPAGVVFLPIGDTSTNDSDLVIDSKGGMHVVYSGKSLLDEELLYGYCAGDCHLEDSWTAIMLDTSAQLAEHIELEIDSQDQLRLLWVDDNIFIGGIEKYKYAECNKNCLTLANWSQVTVTSNQFSTSLWNDYTRYFTLDPQDRPRFLYKKNARVYYVFCDANCSEVANWFEIHLFNVSDLILGYDPVYSLTFTSDGRPRLVMREGGKTTDTSESKLYYSECNNDCQNPANWKLLELFQQTRSDFDLALDLANRPRLAYYRNNKPNYGWCNAADCTVLDNWTFSIFNSFPEKSGKGIDLVLDAQDRPRMVFSVESSPWTVVYLWCDQDCENEDFSGLWQEEALDNPNTIPDFPLFPGCTTQFWYLDAPVSLALDANEKPRFTYEAYNLQGTNCGPDGAPVSEIYRYVRYGQRNHPPTTGQTKSNAIISQANVITNADIDSSIDIEEPFNRKLQAY